MKEKTHILSIIRLLFICFCLIFPYLGASQTTQSNEVDSLLAILPQQSDTVKLMSISKLIDMNYGQAARKDYIDLLLDEAHRQGNSRYEGRALALTVEWYYPQFDNDSVFIAGKKAEDFNRKHQHYNYLFTVQQTLVMRHVDGHQLLMGLRKADDAYAEAKSIGDNMAVARTLSAIASIYETMNQPAEAFKYYRESLDYARKANNPNSFLILENYMNMAAVSLSIKQYETAITCADSMVNHPSGNDAPYLYLAAFFKANANARLHHPEEALKYVRQAETLYMPEFGENFGVYLDEARQDYFRSVRNYRKALEYTGKTMHFYLQNGLLNVGYREALKNKAEILAEMGNEKEAVACFREVLQLCDSLNTQQFYSQINELRTIYELDKAEQQTEQQRMEKERNRIYFLFALGGCLLLSFIVTIIILNHRKTVRKNYGLVRQIREQDKLAAELEQMTNRYAVAIADSRYAAALQNGDTQVETGNRQQIQLVARLHELLLTDRKYTNPNIERDKIVAELETNKTYLFEAIKSVTGKTLQEYVNDMRVDEARQMLNNCPELTIEHIAGDCGLSTRTFYRLFRERYQISPTEYRKINYELRKEL